MHDINKQKLAQANWDDLRIFLTVARQTNLDAAAAILHLDATTLGRRIRRLETTIGATLFNRSSKGHLLSKPGEWMLAQVEQMEAIVTDINESLTGEINRIAGTVRLSVTEAFGNVVIAPALMGLIKAHPMLNIELVATSGFLSVSKREADMAVLLARPTRGRLKVSKLTNYDLKLYASKEYLENHPPIKAIDQLYAHRLIGYVDDLIYSPSLRYYDEIAPGLKPALTSSSLLAQKQLACSGCGIAMLPNFVGQPSKELKLVLAADVTINRSFWLAIHEDIFDHARVQAVMHFLQTLVQENSASLTYSG
ncbi:MAG: LysR family transcriptional regulator [Pseudomonadales bacterium]|nr:LysR family transcriptional regulator [Pseudomonadales bacterium]